MTDLRTVDLDAVEIACAGERVRGYGSPREGEVYTELQLAALAQATNEASVCVPAKIGHFSKM